MLTVEQEKWINHLNDADTVSILPFDPTCEAKFLKVKGTIQNLLGSEQRVEHRGASSLGISGQDEIDVYVPVPAEKFDQTVNFIKGLFGESRSHYPLKRVRFVTDIDKKHVDIFVINQDDNGWKDSEKFNQFLLSHPEMLDMYRVLKEQSAGQSTRKYYRRKTEFINEILIQL